MSIQKKKMIFHVIFVCVRTTYYAYRRDSEHGRRAYDTASGYDTFDDDVSLDFVHAHRVDWRAARRSFDCLFAWVLKLVRKIEVQLKKTFAF